MQTTGSINLPSSSPLLGRISSNLFTRIEPPIGAAKPRPSLRWVLLPGLRREAAVFQGLTPLAKDCRPYRGYGNYPNALVDVVSASWQPCISVTLIL